MRFINIVTKWPGSMHDAAIFEHCSLKNHMEQEDIGHLLGDSGYALKSYLITPFCNPTDQLEEAFNAAHVRGRIVVERAFGVLKSRFRCLHKSGGMPMFSPDRSCIVIGACVRLHNLAISRNVPLPEPPVYDEVIEAAAPRELDRNGLMKRRRLASLFS